ncbi:MAG: dTMP kinase [Parcubacteria group bacterium 21-54-25]|nr:MAG: dTMP kinase [Parcubacteria group bacterium 21-54-25]HQU07525.1 dTMP kinase [Candidatus Paceibacterota bacterium]
MSKRKGTFIAFEGGDGSGKDTVIAELRRQYADRDDLVFTREPGGTVIGEKVRELLLSKDTTGMSFKTELLLFLAARAQLLNEVIIPALQADKTVVANRFGLSTIAYQIYGRGREEHLPFLQSASAFVVGKWAPDVYILLDVPPTVGLARVASRAEETTRFDDERQAFHERVRNGYLKHVSNMNTQYVQIVDASEPLIQVQKKVNSIFAQHYQ